MQLKIGKITITGDVKPDRKLQALLDELLRPELKSTSALIPFLIRFFCTTHGASRGETGSENNDLRILP